MPTNCKCDIGHRGENARECNRKRKPAAARSAHARNRPGDEVVFMRDGPQAAEHDERKRIDENRVRHAKETNAPAPNTSAGTAINVYAV